MKTVKDKKQKENGRLNAIPEEFQDTVAQKEQKSKIKIKSEIKSENDLYRQMQKAKKTLKQKGISVNSENMAAQLLAQVGGKFTAEKLYSRAEEYCKGHQKELVIKLLYLLMYANCVILIARYLYCFVKLDRVILNKSGIYRGLSVILPVLIWMYATTLWEFNFLNIKKLSLMVVIFNAVLSVVQLLYTLSWDTLVTAVFKIRITDAMTRNMVLNLARIVEIVTVAAGIFIMAKLFSPFFLGQEAQEKLMGFKLNHMIDMRKNKQYKYDFTAVYDLKTGRTIRVKQEDRRTHALLLGASGTGKTAAIFLIQILTEVEQKIKNLEKQQQSVLQMMQKGWVKVKEPFKSFGKSHFDCIEEKQQEFDNIFKNYEDCGITVVAPNNALNENILALTSARGVWANNLDPTKKRPTHPYERLVGLNPFYMPEEFSKIPVYDLEKEEERTIYIAENANVFADTLTAINEMKATGDQYFTDVNTTVTVNVATLAMLDASIRGSQITILDIYNYINDFNSLKPLCKRIEEHFAVKIPQADVPKKKSSIFNGYGEWEKEKEEAKIAGMYDGLDERTKENPYTKTLLTVKTRMVKDGKLDEHAEGLRNLLSKLTQDPRVTRVLVPKGEIVDFNRILANNEITLVNTAIEFGDTTSTCFGQLFLLKFNNAVVSRPEHTRTPHYFYEDETARYLAKTIDTMVTFYRQYNVICMFALQAMSQTEAAQQTRYLKQVFLGVGTIITFGRSNVEDSKLISDMGGQERYEMVQKTKQRSSLLSENPSSSTSERTTPDSKNIMDPQDVRFRDQLEMTIITTDEGKVLQARLAKGRFIKPQEFAVREKLIERNRKWMLVWKSKFPRKAQIITVDKDAVLPSGQQEDLEKVVAARDEKMTMTLRGLQERALEDRVSLPGAQLQKILDTDLFPEEPEEPDEYIGEEEYGFEGTEEYDVEFPEGTEEKKQQEYDDYMKKMRKKAEQEGAIL